MFETIPALFAAAVTRHAARPIITWYDDASGERTELSGATLDNWVAKTANLMIDGAGFGTGDRAAVMLPPHWQTAAVLLGCWAAGLAVRPTAPTAPVEVLFAAAGGVGVSAGTPAAERYALSLAPLGAPLREVPPGFVDYVVEVRGHGDRFTPYTPVGPNDPAWLVGPTAPVSHRDLCRLAAGRAAELKLGPNDRVLVDATAYPDPVDWLLAPLAAGASIVLCANLDAASMPARRDAEHVTALMLGAQTARHGSSATG